MSKLSLTDFTAAVLGERPFTLSPKQIKQYRKLYFPPDHGGYGMERSMVDWVIDTRNPVVCDNAKVYKVYDLLLHHFGNIKQCCSEANIGKTTFERFQCAYSLYHYHDQSTDQFIEAPGIPALQAEADKNGIDLPHKRYLYAAANTDGICEIKGHIYGQINRTFYLKKLIKSNA